jgi:peptide/nickel transport system permease protein
MGGALLIGLLFAIPLGIISAVKQNSFVDHLIAFIAFLGVSTPNFFMGLGMVYLFSVKLRIFPSSGMYTLGGGGFLDVMRHLIMPCAVLSINMCARLLRYARASMAEVLQQDYMRAAKAKGAPLLLRLRVHAFRNALLPLITVVALEIPALLGGAVITEQIFSWPGIGRLTIEAVMARDYPVLMCLNLMAAAMTLLSALVADVMYALADPRIKYN